MCEFTATIRISNVPRIQMMKYQHITHLTNVTRTTPYLIIIHQGSYPGLHGVHDVIDDMHFYSSAAVIRQIADMDGCSHLWFGEVRPVVIKFFWLLNIEIYIKKKDIASFLNLHLQFPIYKKAMTKAVTFLITIHYKTDSIYLYKDIFEIYR